MKLSDHFGRTLREAPSDATALSDKLALRAGLTRQTEAGWAYLPLGARVLRQLEGVIQDELAAVGGEEVRIPAGLSAGDAIAGLAVQDVESYRDLPRLLVTFQTHSPADEGRALLHATANSAHVVSLQADADALAGGYEQVTEVIEMVLEQIGLNVRQVEAAHPDAEGTAHAFMLLHAQGRNGMVICSSCDYATTLDAANFARREARFGEPAEMERVHTPNCHTIAGLCAYLNIVPAQTLKLVIYTINLNQPDEAVVLALIRGDLDVSEAKLKRVLGVDYIEPTTEDMIAETGAVAGYASPIGLTVRQAGGNTGVLAIADESVRKMTNFVTGANEAGYHYINVNVPRDLDITQYADIAQPYEGVDCPACGGALHIESAVELGTAKQVGKAGGVTFLSASEGEQPLFIAEYRLHLDRLCAAVIETHHDDYGILWPRSIAPYDVHLVAIGKSADEEAVDIARQLYDGLQAAGLAVLHDDRLLSPGVMFNDADLMGVPLRITVGARSLENGGAEVKRRNEKDRAILPLEGLIETIIEMVRE